MTSRMTTTGVARGHPPWLPLIPDIPEGVLPIGTPCEPIRCIYVCMTAIAYALSCGMLHNLMDSGCLKRRGSHPYYG